MRKAFVKFLFLASISIFILSACGPQPTAAPTTAPTQAATTTTFTIPDIETGKFNVAVVLIGFHADGGWSQAHLTGAEWMTTQDPNIAVKYVEMVNPGPDAESVMR